LVSLLFGLQGVQLGRDGGGVDAMLLHQALQEVVQFVVVLDAIPLALGQTDDVADGLLGVIVDETILEIDTSLLEITTGLEGLVEAHDDAPVLTLEDFVRPLVDGQLFVPGQATLVELLARTGLGVGRVRLVGDRIALGPWETELRGLEVPSLLGR
jgi:hypothetical protein